MTKFTTLKLWNQKEVNIPQHIAEMPDISRGIYTYIYCKRFQDLNYNLTAVGKPGSGKTTALLKMAYELQVDKKTLERNFDVETQVVFTTEGFTKLIKETDPKTEPGKVVIFDEIEIEANSKSWDMIGQIYTLTASTCRYKQNIIMASLPLEQQLVLQGRELRDSRLTCNFIDYERNLINAKFENLEYNVHTKDTYGNRFYSNAIAKGTFFRFNKDDVHYIVDPVWIGNIPRYMDKKYKKMKNDYLSGYYDKQLKVLQERSKEKRAMSYMEIAEFIDKNKEDLLTNKGLVDPVLVHTYTGLPLGRAKEYVRAYNFSNKKLKKEIKNTIA